MGAMVTTRAYRHEVDDDGLTKWWAECACGYTTPLIALAAAVNDLIIGHLCSTHRMTPESFQIHDGVGRLYHPRVN